MAVSSGLGVSALLPGSLGFRNKIINGAMTISQRGTTAISNLGQVNTYGTDRWHAYGSATSKMTITQSTTNPTGQGFSNSTLITSSAATTPDSGHFYGVRQYIEGSNMADLAWGTSGAKPIVVSFWVRSSIAGTYSFALFNSGNNRALISTYTISAVDTWEKKTIYINAGETTGTWETGNGIGTSVWFDLGSGTAANGTANVWNASLLTRTSGSVNWIGTSGATFYVTGVQLEQNYQPTPFEQRPIGVELALCQRYYIRKTATVAYSTFGYGQFGGGTTTARAFIPLPVPLRQNINALDYGGSLNFNHHNVLNYAATSITSNVNNGTHNMQVEIGFTIPSAGPTPGTFGVFTAGNDSNAYIGFSAEL